MFLETVGDFVTVHKVEVHGWMYILLVRLLQKSSGDVFGSVHTKVQRALDIVR